MDEKEANTLITLSREIEEALSTSIKINHQQVTNIVIADLFAKYKHACFAKDGKNAKMLEAVLLGYYLTEEELELMVEAA